MLSGVIYWKVNKTLHGVVDSTMSVPILAFKSCLLAYIHTCYFSLCRIFLHTRFPRIRTSAYCCVLEGHDCPISRLTYLMRLCQLWSGALWYKLVKITKQALENMLIGDRVRSLKEIITKLEEMLISQEKFIEYLYVEVQNFPSSERKSMNVSVRGAQDWSEVVMRAFKLRNFRGTQDSKV